MKRMLVN